jgi:hypothetical protein
LHRERPCRFNRDPRQRPRAARDFESRGHQELTMLIPSRSRTRRVVCNLGHIAAAKPQSDREVRHEHRR